MQRVTARRLGCMDYQPHVEITLPCGRRTEDDGTISHFCTESFSIGNRYTKNCFNAELPCCAQYAYRDLASIRNEETPQTHLGGFDVEKDFPEFDHRGILDAHFFHNTLHARFQRCEKLHDLDQADLCL